jgi:hypothetical protein
MLGEEIDDVIDLARERQYTEIVGLLEQSL